MSKDYSRIPGRQYGPTQGSGYTGVREMHAVNNWKKFAIATLLPSF
jgi:hypothetical protein